MSQTNPLPVSETARSELTRWWSRLLLATVLLALACTTRYFTVTDFEASAGALLFRAVMLTGHFTLVSLVALSPVLLAIALCPRPRFIIPLGVLWSAALLLALLIDTQVYQLYRFHINAGVMNLLMGGAAAETFIFPGVMYVQALLAAFAAIAVIAAIGALAWRDVLRSRRRPLAAWSIAGLLFAATAAFHSLHIWADVVGHEPMLEQTDVLPMRYAATAKRFLRARGVQMAARPAQLHGESEHSSLSYPLQPLACRSPSAPPNIVFILIDSWRFDQLNAQVTPRIEAFSQRALHFLDHHSGGNATRIGVFSLFYSIPGTYWHQMLNERQGPVFIEELLRQRYDVRVFRSAPLYSPEFDRTVFAGVKGPRLRSDGSGPAAWDEDLTTDFLAYLADRGATQTPFFALLFYDSPHSFQMPENYPLVFQPSAPHVNYLHLHANADKAPLLNRYRNSLHYVDHLVGKALQEMERRGLLENTIIVVTGDHGQEFNDTGRNYWGHGSNFSRYQTGVPLIMYAPGLAPGEVSYRTTHFDVAPTLLADHLGCTGPLSAYTVGRSLFDAADREPLVLSEYADFAVVSDDRIAVVRKHGLQVFGPGYVKASLPLDPVAAQAALEQKTRFYKLQRK